MMNIASLMAVGNIVINQLMERKAATIVTTKVASTEEAKWIMVMAKNMRQVVNQVVDTLTDMFKQEEHKLNLCLTRFEA